jgi:hypothetical protein
MEVGPRNVSSPHQPVQPSHFEMAGLNLLTPPLKAARQLSGGFLIFHAAATRAGSGPMDLTPFLRKCWKQSNRPNKTGGFGRTQGVHARFQFVNDGLIFPREINGLHLVLRWRSKLARYLLYVL